MSVRKLGVSTLPKGSHAPWFRLDVNDLKLARQRLQSAPEIVPIRRPSCPACPTLKVSSASSDEEGLSSETNSLSDETEDDEVSIHSKFLPLSPQKLLMTSPFFPEVWGRDLGPIFTRFLMKRGEYPPID